MSYASDKDLLPDELKVYELIVAYFAACHSKHAVLTKTTTTLKVGDEEFVHEAI